MASLRDHAERDRGSGRAGGARHGGCRLTLRSERRMPRAAASTLSCRALLAAALLVCAAPVPAQTIYQYRDENGVLVFTDRPPVEDRVFEARTLAVHGERPEVQLLHSEIEGGTVLIARSTYHAPV